MRARALLVALLFVAGVHAPLDSFARSLPPGVTAAAGGLRPLGAGEMRWFGFKVYEASLWAGPGESAIIDRPFALAIRYARAIPSQQLVETSMDEIRRLGFGDEPRLARWRALLSQALPSVEPGETLVGLHVPNRGARFWHEGRLVAELPDAELARAFFAIWLDERTREPELRARLLGAAEAPR